MAHPEHTPEMDGFDKATVILYRTGVSVTAVGLLLEGWTRWTQLEPSQTGIGIACLGIALSLGNLHLYDKKIRWVMHMTGWSGLACLLSAVWWPFIPLLEDAGFGLVLVAAAGIALKERFCFRIPLLGAVPLLFGASVFVGLTESVWPHAMLARGTLLALAGIPYGLLAIAKWRMPLHFDIGDRSYYQI